MKVRPCPIQTVPRRPARRAAPSSLGCSRSGARSALVAGVASLSLLAGCAALRNDMRLAETAYDEARYDDALVWLDDLEKDTPDMTVQMRSRFYFLRGMTAYRLGQRDDALHYLAVGREEAGDESSNNLRPEWRQAMDRALAELTPQGRSFRARSEGAPDTAAGAGQVDAPSSGPSASGASSSGGTRPDAP